MEAIRFSARTVTGSARGRTLGTPTINLHRADVPDHLEEGIYACWVRTTGEWMMGAMHHGPRPVFQDTASTEIHLLDREVETLPALIEVETAGYLRPVLDFPSTEELMVQIRADIDQSRAMLDAHGTPED